MAPQPYTASGRLTLEIAISGLVHKMRLPCDLHAPGSSPQTLTVFVGGGGFVLASTAAQQLWTLLQPFYNTAIAPPTYVVEQNSGGVFVPLESAALSGNGTNSGANQLCSFFTMTFKSAANHKLKFVMPEHIVGALETLTYPTGNSSLDALLLDFTVTTGASDIGNWVRTRGDERITRIIKATNSYNKRIRRSRHLV